MIYYNFHSMNHLYNPSRQNFTIGWKRHCLVIPFYFSKSENCIKKNHLISYKLKYDTWCQNQSLKYFSVFKISQSNFSVQFSSYKSIGFLYQTNLLHSASSTLFIYIPSQFSFFSFCSFYFPQVIISNLFQELLIESKLHFLKAAPHKKKMYKIKWWKSKKILSIW